MPVAWAHISDVTRMMAITVRGIAPRRDISMSLL
jgi:hypothetical protein